MCGCGKLYCKPGTVDWYERHLDDPLYVFKMNGTTVYKHPVTLRQHVYALLQLVERTSPGRDELEVWLSILSLHCPVGDYNFSVPTLYMLKQLSEASSWTEHQLHVCDSDKCRGHVYSDADKPPGARETMCPNCGQSRFVQHDRGGKIQVAILPLPDSWGC